MEEGGAGSAGWNGPAGSVVAEVEPGSLRSDNRREAQKARCGPEQQTGAISVGEGLSGGHSAAAASEYCRDEAEPKRRGVSAGQSRFPGPNQDQHEQQGKVFVTSSSGSIASNGVIRPSAQ